MEKFDAAQKMRRLIEYLNYHQDQYDAGTPKITDKEWDEAYMELKVLEQEFPSIEFENSPTKKIRYEVVTELKKVSHDEDYPMLSLDKTKEISDIEDKFGNRQWIAMAKCDGLSCRLIYQNGRLIQAATRGNGETGEDITHNAKVVKNIPKWIPHDGRLVVDGEIVCLAQDFVPFAEEYANSRNFASGSIRLLDAAESAKRNLSFIAWDCIYDDESESGFLSAQLEDLRLYGFETVSWSCSDSQSTTEVIDTLKWDSERIGLPIDGIVFKLNNKSEYHAAGTTSHHPSAALAFKFYDEEYETELLDIEYTMGKTGVLTPTAVYKEIEIDGSKCNRASLHNINTMEALLKAPFIGQKIWVYKSNMIIPQISRSEIPKVIDTKKLIPVPEICPLCLGETEIRESDSGTLELYCINNACSGKLINQLEHFCSKKGLDIKGLSKATLEKLIEWGWVSCAKDLFLLSEHRDEWINKPGFGVKSVDKVLDAIEVGRHTTLEKFLSAISIPLIGKTYARLLAKEFETYEHFRELITPDPISGMKPFDFTKLDGFGPAMHEAIMSFNYREADRMVDMGYVEIMEEGALEKSGNALEGKTLCVTGRVHIFKNRDELSAAIATVGGKVTSSVSSKTDYLVNNDIDSTSAKNLKAKELGIPIITEEELLELMK